MDDVNFDTAMGKPQAKSTSYHCAQS